MVRGFTLYMKRTIAAWIDLIALLIVSSVYVWLAGGKNGELNSLGLVPIAGFWFLLLPLPEAFYGQTLGKALLRLQVATMKGKPIAWRHAILRHVCDPLDLILGWMVMFFSIDHPRYSRRIGDYLAGTIVANIEDLI